MPDHQPVTVGAPMLPDRERLYALIDEAMATGRLTNGGMLHDRLEGQIETLAGAPAVLLSSGTMALMMALRLGSLPAGAEVITSPLSFAATVQAIEWCGFRPVFADVEPDYLTLDPRAVEAAITPRTAAILPVHLLGVPCDVVALDAVAKRHGLWLVYDAAHAFGMTWNDEPLTRYGDASAFSLHATKLLHTAEGGFVAARAPDAAERLRRMRNFGLDQGRMTDIGSNGKMSELHAAMGLALIPDLPAEMAAREKLRRQYDAAFAPIAGIDPQATRTGASASLSFYGLRMRSALRALLHAELAGANILTRDHFPLLCGPGTAYPDAAIVTTGGDAVAPTVAPELLCLPLHGGVTDRDVERIRQIVSRCLEQGMQP